jgi:hypothetical protein
MLFKKIIAVYTDRSVRSGKLLMVSSAQPFLVLGSVGLMTIFFCLKTLGSCEYSWVVSTENTMKQITTLCGQNANFLNVKACGAYSNHCALKT